MRIRGIYPPLITPIHRDGSLDPEGFGKLIEHVIRGGVHGLFVMGSCGEGSMVSPQMRLDAAIIARDIGNGRLPLLVGILEQSTLGVIASIRMLEEEGFDTFVVTPPYYLKYPSQEELVRHYEKIAQSIKGRIVLYNIPQFAGACLTAETMIHLSQLPSVVGIKDSDPCWENVQNALLKKWESDFPYMVGNEDTCGAGLLLGGDGIVPCLGNIYPGLFADLYAAALRKDLQQVIELQALVTRLRNIMKYAGNWIACIKYMAYRKGLCEMYTMCPIKPVSLEESSRLDASLDMFEAESGYGA
jgi:4-hydroxy-tetrahydrodipicolinate synthase